MLRILSLAALLTFLSAPAFAEAQIDGLAAKVCGLIQNSPPEFPYLGSESSGRGVGCVWGAVGDHGITIDGEKIEAYIYVNSPDEDQAKFLGDFTKQSYEKAVEDMPEVKLSVLPVCDGGQRVDMGTPENPNIQSYFMCEGKFITVNISGQKSVKLFTKLVDDMFGLAKGL